VSSPEFKLVTQLAKINFATGDRKYGNNTER